MAAARFGLSRLLRRAVLQEKSLNGKYLGLFLRKGRHYGRDPTRSPLPQAFAWAALLVAAATWQFHLYRVRRRAKDSQSWPFVVGYGSGIRVQFALLKFPSFQGD